MWTACTQAGGLEEEPRVGSTCAYRTRGHCHLACRVQGQTLPRLDNARAGRNSRIYGGPCKGETLGQLQEEGCAARPRGRRPFWAVKHKGRTASRASLAAAASLLCPSHREQTGVKHSELCLLNA